MKTFKNFNEIDWWRWYHEFYLDYLRFDKTNGLTLSEIEKNVVISTWLNSKNIKWLAKNLFLTLIYNLDKFRQRFEEWTDIDYGLFSSENSELIFTLSQLFSSYSIITWISTNESWGLSDLKLSLWKIINESWLSRKDKRFLQSILWENNNINLSMEMISKIRDSESKNIETSSETWITLFDDYSLKNPDKLTILWASFISKYLANYKRKIVDASEKVSTWVHFLLSYQ